jgi:hypothetical protein
MWKVLLQPCGDSDAGKHFVDTIEHPVETAQILQHLSSEQQAVLGPIFHNRDAIAVWGVTPGKENVNVGKWERVDPGDTALFSREGHIFASASVAAKIRNESLAESLWKRNGDGETWECIYFLDEVKQLHIPFADFNKAVGYKPNFVIQGFNVLSVERSRALDLTFDFQTLRYSATVGEGEAIDAVTTRFEMAGSLDAPAIVQSRIEQAFLRQRLFNSSPRGTCCICGEEFPTDLMVAAHLKRRSHCSLEEQLDFTHIAGAMCLTGCDALYERGYICVDETGQVQIGPVSLPTTGLSATLQRLVGKPCGRWNAGTEKYFDWHRNFHGPV